ncbi:hypothetical protein FHR25_004954, partial [Yokenella regensburgei]
MAVSKVVKIFSLVFINNCSDSGQSSLKVLCPDELMHLATLQKP